MDPTFMSYLLAARTIRYWYARGAIQADSLCQLIHIATYAALPCIRKAARRVNTEISLIRC